MDQHLAGNPSRLRFNTNNINNVTVPNGCTRIISEISVFSYNTSLCGLDEQYGVI